MAVTPDEKERLFSLLDLKCTWVQKIAPMVGKDFLAAEPVNKNETLC
jgi:hypothetical protein